MPAQVGVLRAVSVYRAVYDDQLKCFSLPHAQGAAELVRVRERASRLTDRKDGDHYAAENDMTADGCTRIAGGIVAHPKPPSLSPGGVNAKRSIC